MYSEPLTFVLEQLADLLLNEFRLLSTDTKEQLESLQLELQLAQSFLMDLEEVNQRASVNHVLQTKAQHVILMVHEIEDFLDTFDQDKVQQSHERSRLTKFMACLTCTRNEKNVRFPTLGSSYIHKARCLTQEESWELFSTILRKNWQHIRSFDDEDNFTRLGNEMLKKCNGLPLAIISLAGLLSSKATIQEWERIKNDMISRIMKQDSGYHDYGTTKEMLELSYFDLPYYLKPCFLYLGIFEEDSDIDVEYLIQLWIAEGFVKSNLCNESEALEEIARDYLDELVQRCMVQVVRIDYEGKVKAIQIHDLMRDLCIEKAEDLSFFEVSSRSALPSTSRKTMSHRAIIHKRKKFQTYSSRLRSFILFQDHGGPNWRMELPYDNLKVLRVLDLVGVCLGDSGEQIGNLILLRYLKIEDCFSGANNLLEYIRKLRNLLTFRYHSYCAEKIPYNMVGSMEHLRHFSLYLRTFESINAPMLLGVDKSRNLQSLRVPASEWLTKELPTVSTGLGDLELIDIHSQGQLEAIYKFVSNQSCHLYRLCLVMKGCSALEFDRQKLTLECCHLLKYLFLRGNLRKQHPPLLFPPNLLSLDLFNTEIEEEEDLEGALSQLAQLRSLRLCNAYKGCKITTIGLLQLQHLKLEFLYNLKDWIIEEGALLQLKELNIDYCYQLKSIPKRISNIHFLQRFEVRSMSESFCKRLQQPSKKDDNGEENGGEDFHLTKHIPSVRIV